MSRIDAVRRYAEAAFELAIRDDKVDAWQRDLALAAEMARDERVARVVDSPAVPFSERRKVVEQLLGKHVSPQALNLALLLAKRGRFGVLPSVSSEYEAKVRQTRGIVAATVGRAISEMIVRSTRPSDQRSAEHPIAPRT